jgi:hypothetical protein
MKRRRALGVLGTVTLAATFVVAGHSFFASQAKACHEPNQACSICCDGGSDCRTTKNGRDGCIWVPDQKGSCETFGEFCNPSIIWGGWRG